MTRSRVTSAASLSARLLIGATAAAGAVALVSVAVFTPWSPVTTTPLSIEERPAAADVTLACAGGILIAGRLSSDAAVVEVAAGAETTAGIVGGSAGGAGSAGRAGAPDGAGAAPEPVTLGTADVRGDSGARSYRAAPEDSAPARLAAAQASMVEADDIRGLAAVGCTPALSESWLVGGATTTGRSGLVQLSNPNDVAATVRLTAYTAVGASTVEGEKGTVIVVPPRAQRTVALAGLAPLAENPVVQVTAQGAPVTATLQSSRIRTITPSGADVQTAIALPAPRQVIAGMHVPQPPEGDETDGITTTVRVLSPAAAGEAVVTVTATGQDAPALAPITVPMEPGVPVDVEVPGLAAGMYSISVVATTPVVAAVSQATQVGPGGDYAWHAAAPMIAVPSQFAVASGATSTLALVNGHTEAATVTVVGPDGASNTVIVPASGSAKLALTDVGVYSIDPGKGAVHAMVSITGPGLNAAYPVWSADAVNDAVRIYP